MVFLFVFANQNSRPSSPFGFVGEVPTRSESSPAPADLPPRSVCLPRLGRGPELLGELLGALDRSFLGVTLNLQLSTFNRVFFSPSSPHLCALCVLCGENSSSFRSSLIPRHSPLTTNSFRIRTYEKFSRNPCRIRTYKNREVGSFSRAPPAPVRSGRFAEWATPSVLLEFRRSFTATCAEGHPRFS